MTAFEIGLSALRVSQVAIDVVANNIANAGTEGFHRQRVVNESLESGTSSGFRVGRGVSIAEISRIRNTATELSLTNVVADTEQVDQLLIIQRQVQEILVSGAGSATTELGNLFAEITELTASAGELSQRSPIIETANRLSGFLRQAANEFSNLQHNIRSQIEQEVVAINEDLTQLSRLNVVIQDLTARGASDAAERDNRDAVINSIAGAVGVSRTESADGQLNLVIGTASIQQASFRNEFAVDEVDGEIQLFLDGSDTPTELKSGRISALQEMYNSTIPKYREKLDIFATELIRQFDSVHATGIGPAGSFEELDSSRTVTSRQAPIGETSSFPIQAGDLTITITEADGSKRNEVVSIDPEVDSLDAISARLNNITGLNSVVETTDNRLRLLTVPGLKFDFTGSVATHPDLTSYTGTAVPELSGAYSGPTNQNVTFEVVGSGNVGLSENLSLNLIDEDGNTIETVSIGRGYEVGTKINFTNGVNITFDSGSVVNGETFTSRFVSNPDETGFLAAIGLNSFFEGTVAGDIGVSARLLDDAQLFASGKTDDIADTTNLFSLTDLEDERTMPGNSTLKQFVNEISVEVGFEISADEALQTSLSSIKERLETDRDSISGVDLNEEVLNLQKYQRSYEAAARVIQVADEALNTILNLFR